MMKHYLHTLQLSTLSCVLHVQLAAVVQRLDNIWKAITFLCGCFSLFGVVSSLRVVVTSLCCVVYSLRVVVISLCFVVSSLCLVM